MNFLQTTEFLNDVDLLVPIPMHASDLWKRGFNHCERILQELSLLSGIPSRRVLLKVKITLPQVQLSGTQRIQNLRNAFRLIPGNRVEGKTILLFDDVYTTGTTLKEAGKALQKGHPAQVHAITIVRTL